MNVKSLFKEREEILIEEYLKRCGVKDVDRYLDLSTIDNSADYVNIKEATSIFKTFVEN